MELTVAVSTIEPAIQKKTFRSDTTALIFSNRKVNDTMKIVTSLKESVLLINFFGMLFDTSGPSILENMSTGKGVRKSGEGVIRAVD